MDLIGLTASSDKEATQTTSTYTAYTTSYDAGKSGTSAYYTSRQIKENTVSAQTTNSPIKQAENHPLTSYSFVLRVEAMYDIPLKSVSAFTKENEYDIIREGGVNDYVHMRRKGVTKPFTFTIERYAGIRPVLDPLPNGAELILPVLLFVYRGEDDVTSTSAIKRVYVFTGCKVQSIQYGALDAEHSGLLTDKITLNYKELICVEIPTV